MSREIQMANLKRGGPGRKRTVRGPIGKLLDRLLTEKGWNMRQYAEVAGLEYQRVQEYVSGYHLPKPDTLSKLLAPFGLTATVIPAVLQIREAETNRFLRAIKLTDDEPITPDHDA